MLNPKIIKTALLGLKASKVQKEIFHPKVQAYLAEEKDEEQLFLNGLSLSFQYFEAGQELPIIEKLSLQVEACPEETLPAVSTKVNNAFEQTITNEAIKHSYDSFIKLWAEQVLAQKKILTGQKVMKIIQVLLAVAPFEKRRLGFEEVYKIHAQRQILSFEEVKTTIIKAFGNTGHWIHDLMTDDEEVDEADFDAKTRQAVFKQYCFYHQEKIVPYLESFFEHETPTNQKYFLKVISQSLTTNNPKIYTFLESFFANNKGKRIAKLNQIFTQVKGLIDAQSAEYQDIETLFKELWQPKSILKKGLKLKPQNELIVQLDKLDETSIELLVDDTGMTDLDLKIFFLLQVVPVDRASQILKIKPAKYIQSISELKTFQKNKNYDPLRALLRNVLKSGDKSLAETILQYSKKTGHAYLELLLLFSDSALYRILENNFELIEFVDRDIFEILVKDLNCQETWSKKLTKLMLDHLLTHQQYYSYGKRFYHALWLGGPFYHDEAESIAYDLMVSEAHLHTWKKEEFLATINQTIHAKRALKNQ